jgi:simple sugar transport system permease protein
MNLDIIVLPAVFVFVVAFMSVATSFKYLSYTNIASILLQLPEFGLFTLAMVLAMAVGGINLSVISTANVSGVVMAWLMVNIIPREASGTWLHIQVALIVLLGLAISIILGIANGFLIAYVEVSPVLATLSTMILFEGLSLAITKGKVISGMPETFVNMGNGHILGLPIPFYIFTVCVIFIRVMVKHTPMGKIQLMIGSNKTAVEYSGINVRKYLMVSYMIGGFLAGVASVIMISRLNSANARFGNSYLLLAVLTSVLGGTDPNGGYVRIGGVIAALFTMQALNSGINFLGVSPFVSTALWGVMLVSIIAYRKYIAKMKDKYLSDISKKAEMTTGDSARP